ncbi:MAG: helix-turn-helix domain-containing protein [Propionibacteriaceae bacterium]|jgi:DNA-binding XRE family transcriptional regulator|nr:helix-turn-helix domain-containing protein [Propionibacteriaceae bacterium]
MPDKRAEFIATCDVKLRLVRVEADLTQEEMAYALGISKKTLVDIEKGRRTLGWTGSVALCAVFPSSEVIASAFGGHPSEMIPALARTDQIPQRESGGNPWWETIADNGQFIIEQNLISQHYRLLTHDRTKVAASFDIDDLVPLFHGQPKE